jgi:hypothetical protein
MNDRSYSPRLEDGGIPLPAPAFVSACTSGRSLP